MPHGEHSLLFQLHLRRSSPGMWRTFDKGTSIPPETSNHPPTVPWRLHLSSQNTATAPQKHLEQNGLKSPLIWTANITKKNNVLVHAVLTETICAHVYTDWKRVTRITRRLSTGYVFGNKRSSETISMRDLSIKTCVIHQQSWWQPSLTAAEPNTMFGNRPYKEKKKIGSALIKVKPFFWAKCDSAGLWIRTKNVWSHHLLLHANKSDSVSCSQLASTKHWDRLIFHKTWYFSRHWQSVLHTLLKPCSRPTGSKMLFSIFQHETALRFVCPIFQHFGF